MRRGVGGVGALLLVIASLGAGGVAGGSAVSTTPATFTVRGSVQQVAVIDAPPNVAVELRRSGEGVIARATTDGLGGYLFRNVDPGRGYRVVARTDDDIQRSSSTRVLSPRQHPPEEFYRQQQLPVGNLGAARGYGYMTTRDGTTLSVQVVLPGPPDQGPYPSVVEYSGYDPSSPTTGQPQYQLLMPQLGFAWVGVNIRGTGCSGGAFNYFETLQTLDGYDAIETVAAQPWSTGKVGMVGISYAGNSQLFVARTQPPHLAAITPLSVIDDSFRGTLYPGGIKNNGFAVNWLEERVRQNKWPNDDAPGWVKARIAGGDSECAHNMLLRGQNVDLLAEINQRAYWADYDEEFASEFPDGGESLAPFYFAHKIRAPVLIVGAWQDEQTGGHFADMLDEFAPGTVVRAIGQNGVHAEALDPAALSELIEFLDFYVAEKIPTIPTAVRLLAPTIWQTITGVGGVTFPPDRFTGYTDFAAAKRAFEAEPPVRILWETGGKPDTVPGSPIPTTETRYRAWPIPETSETAWYFQPVGGLSEDRPPADGGSDSYVSDPEARPKTSGLSGGDWRFDARYDWRPVVDGKSLAYVSEPLDAPVAMAGTGSVDLWLSSSAPDTDLQVTLSEVRSDGEERYVQNGWLRASKRKLDREISTEAMPYQTLTQEDARPLPPGFSKVRVEIFPFAHVFRAGTRIRVTIEAPGGDRPLWKFETLPGTQTNTVSHDAARASRVVLPVVPAVQGLSATPAPCPSLRAQPCRAYVAPTTPAP